MDKFWRGGGLPPEKLDKSAVQLNYNNYYSVIMKVCSLSLLPSHSQHTKSGCVRDQPGLPVPEVSLI